MCHHLQDEHLEDAINKHNVIVPIIGWYPASRDADIDTNSNATTRSLKSSMALISGVKLENILVIWLDLWPFCHQSCNKNMCYKALNVLMGCNNELKRLCADMLVRMHACVHARTHVHTIIIPYNV